MKSLLYNPTIKPWPLPRHLSTVLVCSAYATSMVCFYSSMQYLTKICISYWSITNHNKHKQTDHRNFADLSTLLVSLGSDAQQAAKQEVRDLKLDENVGQSSNSTEYLTHHAIGSTQCRIYLCTNTCQQKLPNILFIHWAAKMQRAEWRWRR